MAILTVSQLQEHLETDLGSDALQRLAEATEEMIDREDGGTAAVTEDFDAFDFLSGRDRRIYTTRAISAITSITERESPDDDVTTLSADDYRQQGDRTLTRLRDGTNPRLFWAPHVRIVYTPVVDSSIRELVQIDLVKMAINYTGAQRERMGDFDFLHVDHKKETESHLSRLRTGKNRMMIA